MSLVPSPKMTLLFPPPEVTQWIWFKQLLHGLFHYEATNIFLALLKTKLTLYICFLLINMLQCSSKLRAIQICSCHFISNIFVLAPCSSIFNITLQRLQCGEKQSYFIDCQINIRCLINKVRKSYNFCFHLTFEWLKMQI